MEIDVLDQSTIDRVISIVDNTIYKTNNATTTEIDTKLKETLSTSFVDFFGEHHKDKVCERIEGMDINRCYHIFGSRNSISSFIIEQKNKLFNEGKSKTLTNPNDLLECFSIIPIEEILFYATYNSSIANGLNELCDYFGISKDSLDKPDGKTAFTELVNKEYEEFKKTPLSNNPEINEQMSFLNEYVEAYKLHLKKNNLSNKTYKDNTTEIFKNDPVFKKLTENLTPNKIKEVANTLFLPTSDCEAFACDQGVFFGMNPTTRTIIHETFHRVVYNLNMYETSKSGFRDISGKNRLFNEIVTDYYSQKIYEKFLATGGEILTINDDNIPTFYENYLLKYMTPFLDTFAPECKEVLMRDDPINEMQGIIGINQFINISSCCDTLFNLGHDANAKQIENKLDLFKAETKLKVNTFLAKMKKSPLERVFNAISLQAENFATNAGLVKEIDPEKNPHLSKLVNASYAMIDFINNHTQSHVRNKLEQKAAHETKKWNINSTSLESVDNAYNKEEDGYEM